MNFNKILLAGNLTRDPETRTTQGGMTVCKFGLAVNRKSNGKEEVLFVDCTAFGKTAELVTEHFTKGKPIFVEGRLQLEQWEDKDGGKRSRHSVIVESISFVGGGKDKEDEKPRRQPAQRTPDQDYGEVPF